MLPLDLKRIRSASSSTPASSEGGATSTVHVRRTQKRHPSSSDEGGSAGIKRQKQEEMLLVNVTNIRYAAGASKDKLVVHWAGVLNHGVGYMKWLGSWYDTKVRDKQVKGRLVDMSNAAWSEYEQGGHATGWTDDLKKGFWKRFGLAVCVCSKHFKLYWNDFVRIHMRNVRNGEEGTGFGTFKDSKKDWKQNTSNYNMMSFLYFTSELTCSYFNECVKSKELWGVWQEFHHVRRKEEFGEAMRLMDSYRDDVEYSDSDEEEDAPDVVNGVELSNDDDIDDAIAKVERMFTSGMCLEQSEKCRAECTSVVDLCARYDFVSAVELVEKSDSLFGHEKFRFVLKDRQKILKYMRGHENVEPDSALGGEMDDDTYLANEENWSQWHKGENHLGLHMSDTKVVAGGAKEKMDRMQTIAGRTHRSGGQETRPLLCGSQWVLHVYCNDTTLVVLRNLEVMTANDSGTNGATFLEINSRTGVVTSKLPHVIFTRSWQEQENDIILPESNKQKEASTSKGKESAESNEDGREMAPDIRERIPMKAMLGLASSVRATAGNSRSNLFTITDKPTAFSGSTMTVGIEPDETHRFFMQNAVKHGGDDNARFFGDIVFAMITTVGKLKKENNYWKDHLMPFDKNDEVVVTMEQQDSVEEAYDGESESESDSDDDVRRNRKRVTRSSTLAPLRGGVQRAQKKANADKAYKPGRSTGDDSEDEGSDFRTDGDRRFPESAFSMHEHAAADDGDFIDPGFVQYSGGLPATVIVSMNNEELKKRMEKANRVVPKCVACSKYRMDAPDHAETFWCQTGFRCFTTISGTRGVVASCKSCDPVLQQTSVYCDGCWKQSQCVPEFQARLEQFRNQDELIPDPHMGQCISCSALVPFTPVDVPEGNKSKLWSMIVQDASTEAGDPLNPEDARCSRERMKDAAEKRLRQQKQSAASGGAAVGGM